MLTSVHWHDALEGKNRETDAIAIVDGILLIFEAKGDALNSHARRGSETWFKAFDDIAAGAAYQAWRFETAVRDTAEPILKLETAQGSREIRKKDIRHIVKFSASFERVTGMSFGLDQLLQERIRRTGASPMPIFTIGDLWQVRDMLPSEGHRLHFLLRRAELEEDYEFLGDELDILALYLRTGFIRMGRKGEDGGVINAYGLSGFLRHFQKATSHYDPAAKRPRRTTSLWNRLISDKEQRRPRNWTDVVYDLLNIEYASQVKFVEDINAMRRTIRREARGAYDGVQMQAPQQLPPSLFICLVMGRMSNEGRIATARKFFTEKEAEHPDERIFILVLDTAGSSGEPAFPYYRGVRWERRPQVEIMEGTQVLSQLSVEFSGD